MIYAALGHVEEEVDQLSENAVKAKLPDKLQCLATQPVFWVNSEIEIKRSQTTFQFPLK